MPLPIKKKDPNNTNEEQKGLPSFEEETTVVEHVANPNGQEEPQEPEKINEVKIDLPIIKDTELLSEREEPEPYINKKKFRIIPFGGTKSKERLAKAGDFDKRKNRVASIRIIRFLSIIAILVVFALGIKNTWFPEQIYTPAQIRQIAMNAVNDTGFPKLEGENFAKAFLYYFLNGNDNGQDTMLAKYYEGYNIPTKRTNRDSKQRILQEPEVSEITALTDSTCMYKFTVVLSNSEGEEYTLSPQSHKKENARVVMAFGVTVYYDKDTKSFSITKDSPTLLPVYNVNTRKQLPKEQVLGNGEQDDTIADTLEPTINGFVRGYLQSSYTQHEWVDQYIVDSNDIDLISGFNNTVALASNDNASIHKTIYKTNKENEYKVDLYLNLKSTEVINSHTFIGRYVLTIVKSPDGKYLVSKFAPYKYFPESN